MQIQANPGRCASAPPRNFKRRRTSSARDADAAAVFCIVRTASSSPSRGGTARDTVLIGRSPEDTGRDETDSLETSAVQRFLLSERHKLMCATRSRLIDHRNKTSSTISFDGFRRLFCPSPRNLSICVQQRCLPSGGLTRLLS